MPRLLEVTGLTAAYGPTQVLHGVDFAIEAGGITALLGANGAGKTTTLRAICQMVKTGGSVRLDGRELVGSATESVVRLGVAHVPDGRGTFGALSVEENLKLGAYVRKDRGEVAHDIEKAYVRFPRLAERRHQQAGTLSGGEQQMLAMGRAMMSRPSLLLLDEPSMGLAPVLVEAIFSTVEEINRQGTTILLVEQNALMALQLASRGYVLQTGEIVLSDSAKALQRNAMVQKVYLGIE